MYAVMLCNDDCNIISYRIDRNSEWSVEKSRHLQNRIVFTIQCVTRRIRPRKFKHFSRVHVTLSSLQYSPYSWIFFFFYARLALPSDVKRWNASEHGRQSGPAKWERGRKEYLERYHALLTWWWFRIKRIGWRHGCSDIEVGTRYSVLENGFSIGQ